MQSKVIPFILLVEWIIYVQSEEDVTKIHRLRCDGRSCNPPVGNLATGRTPITFTSCGKNVTELYCYYPEQHLFQQLQASCDVPQCTKCSVNQPENSHPPSHMTDDVFSSPATWWQSTQGVLREEIRLNFETKFYLTHVIMVFKSPRPAAMVLERSHDHGKTWRPYKYFATNCTATFGLQDDLLQEGSICTSRYSGAWPCTRGEVIFRALTPTNRIEDPYSPHAQDLLKMTNLRLLLLKRQECPCQAFHQEKPNRFAYYAIYDLIVRGSCLCNGHAEECQQTELKEGSETMVHGKCVCQHNTAGDHCERCAPLYNDHPWRPGDGKTGAPNACRRCRCHNHASSCRFDLDVWLSSGRRTGGVCENCQHNTEGYRCQRCKSGYYRDLTEPLSSPVACKECFCHLVGSANETLNRSAKCHSKTGFCYCKPGVAGPYCDRCMLGYWGFGENGCRPCDCARDCDANTGDCRNSHEDENFLNIPIGGRIPEILELPTNESEDEWKWNSEQGFSALRHPDKCVCKERLLRSVTDFCQMKYAYVIKARILSAHDKGTHAEVVVKVRKVLKSGKVKIARTNRSLYPESWTNRGCTCPILNPGTDYLIAGPEDNRTNKLLVNMNSLVKPWKAVWAKQAMDIIRSGCKKSF
ncbi:netrin-4-like [Pelobates cultripes]|uniref:Netrin-1 n=1 Tax=Pelobates cultripes TaxID=61616 RepID=A0AAD1SUG1_PELCU|nr:netrin-4-like [Pelobates cultripes]